MQAKRRTKVQKFIYIAGLFLALSTATRTFAAAIAADDSSDPAYYGGWNAGTDGGYGFTPWQMSGPYDGDPSHGGYFVGDSTTNGDAGSSSPGSSGGINVNGVSWALYANNGQIADARRQFTDGPLQPGQTFSVAFDNGWVDNDGTVGISLQAGVFDSRFEFYFRVGDPEYTINDASGPHFANFNYTDSGIDLSFTLLDANDYLLELQPADGGIPVFDTGQLSNAPGYPDIDNFRVYNYDAGDGTPRDFFINSMSVVPEPRTVGLLLLTSIPLTLRRRSRA